MKDLKQLLFSEIKWKLEHDSKVEAERLTAIRLEKEKTGEKIVKSDTYNEKEYEVIELHSGIVYGGDSDTVYLRKILCVSSIDMVKVPLYKIRYVNIYQLAYELDLKELKK